VRKIVEVDSIYNNLFSEAIPFLFKKIYFRFFFEVYIRTLPDIRFIDINDDKFISLLTYIVLEDLKVYGDYLPGLLLPTPEEEEASTFNDQAKAKQQLKHKLEEQAGELQNQFDRNKQQREIDKFKDYKMKLSPLTAAKSLPLYYDDKNEYWLYLTSTFGNEDRDDGLLHFLVDVFDNIENNPLFEMSHQLIEIVSKIRNVLATMSDTLYLLYFNNPNELPNLPRIIKNLDFIIQKIPTAKMIHQRKRLNLEHNEENKSEAESDEEETKEEQKDGQMGTDKNSEVQKIIQIVRDYIITKTLGIRQAFNLPDNANDVYLEFHEFKRMLKEICGKRATYHQIENTTEFIFKGTIKLEAEKKKQDDLAKILEK
jgi:hypothetical protein